MFVSQFLSSYTPEPIPRHQRPTCGYTAFQVEEWIDQRTCPLWTISIEGLACSLEGVPETTV